MKEKLSPAVALMTKDVTTLVDKMQEKIGIYVYNSLQLESLQNAGISLEENEQRITAKSVLTTVKDSSSI